jgi:hypothetical protein
MRRRSRKSPTTPVATMAHQGILSKQIIPSFEAYQGILSKQVDAQSAEGAAQPSPDRDVGVGVRRTVSPVGGGTFSVPFMLIASDD